jgi:hypothetical protein
MDSGMARTKANLKELQVEIRDRLDRVRRTMQLAMREGLIPRLEP